MTKRVSSGSAFEQDIGYSRIVEQFLTEAGASIETILRVLLIIPKRTDLDAMLPVIRRYLQRARPTSTMIIAGLMDERMKLEVEMTARLRA